MSGEIAALLARDGTMTSGALATALTTNPGISLATGRKRIERRLAPVRAVKLVSPRGAQFLYLENQYGNPRFSDRLTEALMDENGAYARAIKAWFLGG